MRLAEAVDLYLGDVARRLAPRTRLKYEQLAEKFVEHMGENYPINEIRPEHCMTWLSKWNDAKPKTKKLHETVLRNLFGFAVDMDFIEPNDNPMIKVRPTRVPPIEDRDVKTITSDEVKAVIASCHTWSEMICVAVLACMGVRRQADNDLKWKDVRFATGHIRFKEKGGKIIWKPMPSLLENLLTGARESELDTNPDDYVIPSEGKLRNRERDADYIYRVIKRVSKRAGVDAHCHAFRAAFAVHFLETHEGDLEALQPLMGHTNLATTQVYLRRFNREVAMERVRDLDWGVGFGALSERASEAELPVIGATQPRDSRGSTRLEASDISGRSLSALSEGEKLRAFYPASPEASSNSPSESAPATPLSDQSGDGALTTLPRREDTAGLGFEPRNPGKPVSIGQRDRSSFSAREVVDLLAATPDYLTVLTSKVALYAGAFRARHA